MYSTCMHCLHPQLSQLQKSSSVWLIFILPTEQAWLLVPSSLTLQPHNVPSRSYNTCLEDTWPAHCELDLSRNSAGYWTASLTWALQNRQAIDKIQARLTRIVIMLRLFSNSDALNWILYGLLKPYTHICTVSQALWVISWVGHCAATWRLGCSYCWHANVSQTGRASCGDHHDHMVSHLVYRFYVCTKELMQVCLPASWP